MVTPVEIGLLAAALIGLFVAFKLLKAVKGLAVNAIVGVVILFVANLAGLGVQISWLSVLVCAIAGVPGAVLIIILSYLDIAFVAGILTPVL
ncbi:pro-sigmaK processing inhibitor BofA family protein [Haloparvum sedimenti]|uniref:pro-sigmaK processing inhibitor BofA family protein n=1 Tax=Haloparvum sedimenti TaxID=1678448 RepID=UPI0009B5AD14|nr:pro-sigmaK processing inhibitor BofA family protein [Haloparvum sedimenti]